MAGLKCVLNRIDLYKEVLNRSVDVFSTITQNCVYNCIQSTSIASYNED